MDNEFDKYYEATEPGYRERAIGWATAIGLQDVDGLKPSKYLIKTAKRNIEGEITANDGVNDGVKSALNGKEEKAVKAILRNGRINALELASELGGQEASGRACYRCLEIQGRTETPWR